MRRRPRIARTLTVTVMTLGLTGLATMSASADPLPNGLNVFCNANADGGTTCLVGGCPRVGGDYVPLTIHVMRYGNQEENDYAGCAAGREFPVVFNPEQPATFGVQVCRKHDFSEDDCGPYADYTYNPPAGPAVGKGRPAYLPPDCRNFHCDPNGFG
jgi:hypothetical protein